MLDGLDHALTSSATPARNVAAAVGPWRRHKTVPLGIKGFTLIESLVALLLLTLLMSFSLSDLQRTSRRSNLAAAARQLAAELRLARIRAISMNTSYRILLHSGDDWYARQSRSTSGYRDDGPALKFPDGVVTISCSSPSGGISFRPRGMAGDFGTVILANPDNEQRKVVVAFTGEVRIE